MVEWKNLTTVAEVQYGYPFDSSLFSEDENNIPLIRIRDVKPGEPSTYFSGEYPSEYIIHKGDILVGMDGEFNLAKWKSRDGLLNQRVLKLTGKNNQCLNGYLFHYMGPVFKKIELQTAGGSVKHLSAKAINRIKIPIPSLEEQNRIVGILDTFTDSIENLKQQIAQRRKQYEHYRDQLLDLEGKEGVEMKTILDVCESNRGVRVIKKELKESGDFPVFQNSITPMGYYHKCNYKKPTTFVITAGAAGEVGFCDTPFWAADDCLCLTCSEKVLSKYVFYFLSKKNFYLKSKVRKGAIPRLSRKVVETLIIPIINTELQKVIIKQLDTFEASITNLEAQLAQRQKQYEYYRNQLLTFEEG